MQKGNYPAVHIQNDPKPRSDSLDNMLDKRGGNGSDKFN